MLMTVIANDLQATLIGNSEWSERELVARC